MTLPARPPASWRTSKKTFYAVNVAVPALEHKRELEKRCYELVYPGNL